MQARSNGIRFNDYPAAQSNVGGLTERLFCLDNNTQIYAYRHMNVKIAADIVKDFADQYPNLFVGVSTDSEIHLATADSPSAIPHGVQFMYDYNPGMIAEFQQWLQNQYGSITALDTQFNLNFANWTSVDPPRIYQPGNPWFEAWTNFRTYIVQQNVNAEAQWIAEEGNPTSQIYTHQILSVSGDLLREVYSL